MLSICLLYWLIKKLSSIQKKYPYRIHILHFLTILHSHGPIYLSQSSSYFNFPFLLPLIKFFEIFGNFWQLSQSVLSVLLICRPSVSLADDTERLRGTQGQCFCGRMPTLLVDLGLEEGLRKRSVSIWGLWVGVEGEGDDWLGVDMEDAGEKRQF